MLCLKRELHTHSQFPRTLMTKDSQTPAALAKAGCLLRVLFYRHRLQQKKHDMYDKNSNSETRLVNRS